MNRIVLKKGHKQQCHPVNGLLVFFLYFRIEKLQSKNYALSCNEVRVCGFIERDMNRCL